MKEEVQPGFKRTELGLVPEHWTVRRLDQIARIERGKFSARPRNDPRYFGGSVPFIQTGDVTACRGTITSYSQTLNEAGVKVSRVFPAGTLLFTIAANIGDMGISSVAVACPDSLVAMTPGREALKTWLLHALRPKKKEFETIASHNTQLNLNLEKLRAYQIAIPPVTEQRAIATALSDADALLGSLEQLIARKKAIKQGALQALLTPPGQPGHKRLPGFTGVWGVKRLDQLGTFSKGKGILKYQVQATGLPCIRYGEIYTVHHNVVKQFYSFVAPETAAESRRLRTGDLLFAGSGETSEEIGKCVAFVDDVEAYVGGDIVILSPVGYDSTFLGYLMNHSSVITQKARLGQGDAVVHISGNNLALVEVCLPPSIKEQSAIAQVITDMDNELVALESKLEKLWKVKQGMMQELLTGRKRLV